MKQVLLGSLFGGVYTSILLSLAACQPAAEATPRQAVAASQPGCDKASRKTWRDARRCNKHTYTYGGQTIWIDYESGCEYFYKSLYNGYSTVGGQDLPRTKVVNGQNIQICRSFGRSNG